MIASLTFTSCEDFLTEEVRGQQNLDTYFQSAEEAEAFITGCYQAITFGGWWNINTVWLLSEMCSDDGCRVTSTSGMSRLVLSRMVWVEKLAKPHLNRRMVSSK